MMKRFSFFVAAGAIVASGVSAPAFAALPKHRVTGTILSVNGPTVVMQRANGTTVTVDLTEALAIGRAGIIQPTVIMTAHGAYNTDGSFHCVFTSHAPPTKSDFDPDQ